MPKRRVEGRELIDWRLLGNMLRARRKEAGYKKAEDLSEAIRKLLGQDVNVDAIYKIEQGKQRPTLTQLVAFSVLLYGTPMPDELIRKSLTNELLLQHASLLIAEIETC